MALSGKHPVLSNFKGSVEEILDDINVSLDEGYGDKAYNEGLKADGYALIAKINGYIAYLRKCKQGANEVICDL